jgi:hypothetical protein
MPAHVGAWQRLSRYYGGEDDGKDNQRKPHMGTAPQKSANFYIPISQDSAPLSISAYRVESSIILAQKAGRAKRLFCLFLTIYRS